MIFLKDKYRIVLDKRNIVAVVALIATMLFFLYSDGSILYQTPILIIMTSAIVIDMLSNKVNPFHIDSLKMAQVNEKQAEAVFTIFLYTMNLVVREVIYPPNHLLLKIRHINIGQLKDVTLSIEAVGTIDQGEKTVDIFVTIYSTEISLPLVSLFIPIKPNFKDTINNIKISKNLDRWKDIIVLAKTIEYFLLNHQYDGTIKNEERRI